MMKLRAAHLKHLMLVSLVLFLNACEVYAASEKLRCPSNPPQAPAGETKFHQSEQPLAGVVHSIGSADYVRIPDEFQSRMRKNTRTSSSSMGKEILTDSSVVSLIDESPNRATYMVRSGNQENVMVTKWRFTKDGALICNIDSNTNSRIDGWPSPIALVESPVGEDVRACVWKVDVVYKEKTQYEFWIKDTCTAGKPETSRKNIIKTIQKLKQIGP